MNSYTPQFSTAPTVAEPSALGLSMSRGDLALCTQSFHSTLQRIPSHDELTLLDAVIRERRERPSSFCVGNVLSADASVCETARDLLEKSRYLRLSDTAQSFFAMARIAPEYIRTLTGERPEQIEADVPMMPQPDAQANITLPPEVALVLLLPPEGMPMNTYIATVNMISSYPNLHPALGVITPVKPHGLIPTLVSLSSGIYADLSLLDPSCDLSTLTDRYAGLALVPAYRYIVDSLIAAANAHGLSAIHFAKTNATGTLTVSFGEANAQRPPVTIPTTLIKTLIGGVEVCDVNLSRAPTPYPPSVSLARGTADPDEICTASLTGECADPFGASASMTAAALLEALARGYKRGDVQLRTSFTLSSDLTSESARSDSAAAILGAYRSLIELCVSASSSVVYTDRLRASVTALAKKPRRHIPEFFCGAGHKVYLATVPLRASGLVDFEALRALSAELERASASRSILSARAVCGDIGETILSMSRFAAFAPLDSASAYDRALGVIIESASALPFIELGSTAPSPVSNSQSGAEAANNY